ncbi:MAG TPA: zinc-binding alcohol dehydrogenase family protein [Lacipirellulaceae bacterium]|nr:zinc-binding alcohol dehydrogenase family protein [Lacipirellulaceae bacterium]
MPIYIMKAFVINSPGVTSFRDVPEPVPGAGDVLLRVRAAGFCGTDLSTFRGVNPLVSYPRIPGHELGCTIEAIGSAVPKQFRIGQDVLVHPYKPCGGCTACLQQRPNCCRDNETLGVQREGGMTELIAAPWQTIYTSEKLSLREMALVEPLTIGYHAVQRGRVKQGDVVAVFGCGAIGLGVLAAAANHGANVIAIDVDDRKLAVARKVDAQHTINSMTADLHAELQKLTAGQGPPVLIEAVGLPQTFRAAVDEACFGGRVVYIGYAKKPVEYDTRHIVQRELDIMGSRNALSDDFRAVIAYLEQGTFPVSDVVTHVVPFHQAGEALAAWSATPAEFIKIHVEVP